MKNEKIETIIEDMQQEGKEVEQGEYTYNNGTYRYKITKLRNK